MRLLVNAFAVNGMGVEALEVFQRMPSQFIDEVAYLCVLNACSHAGLIDQARLIFERAPQKTFKIFTVMVRLSFVTRPTYFFDR